MSLIPKRKSPAPAMTVGAGDVLSIAFFSNGPNCPSGYGQQTSLIVPRLSEAGHKMAILASHGFEHGISNWKGVPIYPRSGTHAWSQDTVGENSRDFGADITICFLDTWVLEPERYGHSVRAIAMFPVDHEPIPPEVAWRARQFWGRITYSLSGFHACQDAGLDSWYIPHGIDCSSFTPMDRDVARKLIGLPTDREVIFGIVAANHDPIPSRKGWEQLLVAFALFVESHPDALLYIHGPVYGGVNVEHLVGKLGLKNRVIACDQKQYKRGFSVEHMNATMNALDCLLMPSMGEGCGLPLLEAQASGTPVVCGDWTAMPEICFAGIKIPKSKAYHYDYTNHYAGQWRVYPSSLVEAMEEMLERRAEWPALRLQAREGALTRDMGVVLEKFWTPALADIASRIADEKKALQTSLRPAMTAPILEAETSRAVAAAKNDPPDMVIIIPSHGERCGIAEYGESAVRELAKAGTKAQIVLSALSARQIALAHTSVRSVLLLHEYAFLDGNNTRLGRGETTPALLMHLGAIKEARPEVAVSVQMHTITQRPEEHGANEMLRLVCPKAGIRLFSTCMSGARHLGIECLPLGAWEIPPLASRLFGGRDNIIALPADILARPLNRTVCPKCKKSCSCTIGTPSVWVNCEHCGHTGVDTTYWDRIDGRLPERLTIGNFGFFGTHRDIPAQMELCERTGSRFLGSFYCEYAVQRKQLATLLGAFDLPDALVWTDFPAESEIVARLRHADVLYMPRPDNGNFYSSASAPTALCAERPIIINRAVCYEDLWDTLLIADTWEEAIPLIERLKDPGFYGERVDKIRDYKKRRGIARLWDELCVLPPASVIAPGIEVAK